MFVSTKENSNSRESGSTNVIVINRFGLVEGEYSFPEQGIFKAGKFFANSNNDAIIQFSGKRINFLRFDEENKPLNIVSRTAIGCLLKANLSVGRGGAAQDHWSFEHCYLPLPTPTTDSSGTPSPTNILPDTPTSTPTATATVTSSSTSTFIPTPTATVTVTPVSMSTIGPVVISASRPLHSLAFQATASAGTANLAQTAIPWNLDPTPLSTAAVVIASTTLAPLEISPTPWENLQTPSAFATVDGSFSVPVNVSVTLPSIATLVCSVNAPYESRSCVMNSDVSGSLTFTNADIIDGANLTVRIGTSAGIPADERTSNMLETKRFSVKRRSNMAGAWTWSLNEGVDVEGEFLFAALNGNSHSRLMRIRPNNWVTTQIKVFNAGTNDQVGILRSVGSSVLYRYASGGGLDLHRYNRQQDSVARVSNTNPGGDDVTTADSATIGVKHYLPLLDDPGIDKLYEYTETTPGMPDLVP